MAIQVTCPGCHARFQVSDKFAGQTGPCPKCKSQIRIPEKSEEVVIHAPENYGPKTAQGKAVLKPLTRQDTQLSPPAVVGVVVTVVVCVVIAVVLGRVVFPQEKPWLVLAFGALLTAPLLVYAGYTVLRNDELEPYRGTSLLTRVVVCSLVYAALWLAYWYLKHGLLGGDSLELYQLAFVVPGLLGLGGVASLAALDLDYGSAVIHCGFYLLSTSLLRVLMGLPFF